MRSKRKLTLEKILISTPNILDFEEIREVDGQIQVRCKFCNNLFNPTNSQLHERLRRIRYPKNNSNSYFYCSEKCKLDSPLFARKTTIKHDMQYKNYMKKVYRITRKNWSEYKENIPNNHLRGFSSGFELDHMYSIYDGFINNVEPEVVGHWKNLRVVTRKENREKSQNSILSLEYLMSEILPIK